MKQTFLTCFLLVRLARLTYPHNGDGEYSRWYKNSLTFALPVSCKFEGQVKVGDDLIQTIYLKEKLQFEKSKTGKDWSMVVLEKHFLPDLEELEELE